MRRTMISLALGAALSLALVGCSMGEAPAVTPTPAPTNSIVPNPDNGMKEPTLTDDAHYDAESNGKVEGTTPPAGTVTKNAVDKAGNAIRQGVDDVKRGVDDMMY